MVTSEQELVVTFENAKSKIASSNIERREYYIDVLETIRIKAFERFSEIKQITLVEQVSNVTERIDTVVESFKKQVIVHLEAAKKGEHVVSHHQQQQPTKESSEHDQEKKHHHSIGAAIAAGAAVAVGAGAVAAIVHHEKHKNDSQGGGHVEHKPAHQEKHEQEHHEEQKKPQPEHHEQKHEQVEYHQHHEKIAHDIVKTGTVIVVVEHVKTTITTRLEELVEEVRVSIEKGHAKTAESIETIVSKATASIKEELKHICSQAEQNVKCKSEQEKKQLVSTITWAITLITEITIQIQTIYVKAISSSTEITESTKQSVTEIIESTKTKIHTEFEKCHKNVSDEHQDKSSSKHLVEIEVTEYTITRIRYHFTTIIEEICVHIVNGKSEHDVKELVAKLKKTLESELAIIITKIKDVKGSQTVIDTINWAKGMIEQCIVTVEAMAVQFVAAHSKDKKVIYDQMIAQVEAIMVQIKTALERCGASFKIHTGDDKKVDTGSAKHESQGSSKSVVTVEVTEYTVTHIRYCFTTIIEEVCVYIVKGKSESDVKSLVSKLRKTLEGSLEVITTKVKHCSHGDKQQLADLIVWAKGMIEQAVVQIEAMAVQAVAAHSKDKDAIYEQMTTHVEAILVQIKTALERFKTSSIKIDVDKSEASKVVEHKECKKTTEKKKDSSCSKKKQDTKKKCGSSGKSASSGTKKTSGGKSSSGTMEITEYTITRIHVCFTTVIEKITVCVVKGDSSEITKLIAKAKKSIESELSVAIEKVKGRQSLIDTITWVKGMVAQGLVQIEAVAGQLIAAHNKDKKVISQQLNASVEAIIVEIKTALERCDKSVHLQVGKKKSAVSILSCNVILTDH